jgi:hypothetical protein
MTQDEIIDIGIQANLCDEFGSINMEYDYKAKILAFAKLVAAKEREACARLCDELAVHPEYASEVTKLAALVIRARDKYD